MHHILVGLPVVVARVRAFWSTTHQLISVPSSRIAHALRCAWHGIIKLNWNGSNSAFRATKQHASGAGGRPDERHCCRLYTLVVVTSLVSSFGSDALCLRLNIMTRTDLIADNCKPSRPSILWRGFGYAVVVAYNTNMNNCKSYCTAAKLNRLTYP